MTLVVIESPYSGDVERNEEYLKRAMRDSISRGEAPYASHLIYTQVLNDRDPEQRKKGINMGFKWGQQAEKVIAYTDYGISTGMEQGLAYYNRNGIPIEYRKIGENIKDPISIVTFKWSKEGYRSKFTSEHVNKLFEMIDKNTTVPYKAFCVTDDPKGIDPSIQTVKLWPNPCPRYAQTQSEKPNCFYRLKMFDPEMKKTFGEKFLWIDLDAVITGNIDNILTDPADFKMWRVDGEYMPVNGSLCLHKIGTRPEIWKGFRPEKVHPVNGLRKSGMIGSDQAWISLNLKDGEADHMFGQKHGVYSFRCHLQKHMRTEKRNKTELPKGCNIVFFHGRHDPWQEKTQEEAPWIKEAYKVS